LSMGLASPMGAGATEKKPPLIPFLLEADIVQEVCIAGNGTALDDSADEYEMICELSEGAVNDLSAAGAEEILRMWKPVSFEEVGRRCGEKRERAETQMRWNDKRGKSDRKNKYERRRWGCVQRIKKEET